MRPSIMEEIEMADRQRAMESAKALQLIRDVTDGALLDAGILEAVTVLISQRDNARIEADVYKSRVMDLKARISGLEAGIREEMPGYR